jgi:hypothetical protein
MGTHTIASASATKTGATTAKMDRYQSFCSLASGPSKRTWYAERFPDAWRPEVLFLVRSKVREGSVQRAIDGWNRAHPQAACTFWVATVESALARLQPLLGQAGEGARLSPEPAPPGRGTGTASPTLTPEDVHALKSFYAAVQAEWKHRRDRARAAQQPVPDYPPGTKGVHELYERLRRLA